ncbi:MAG: SsrA-binding protein SmpB [Bacilli bacterium]|nr:SsrA-binding protein SmpB [Bacilli bacterium]
MEILNRRAKHDYFIDEVLEAGIALTGTEIKSIRQGSANIKDSYAIIKNNEVILLNMYVAEYKEGNIFNHDETRDRKLLLHKKEIRKLIKYKEKGNYTFIPLKLYFKKNLLKVELGVCRGKKEYEKKETIKERDIQRDIRKQVSKY